MTALFSAQRRAEEFHAAVEAPPREVHPELRPLVDLVGTLRTHAAADPLAVPRDEFAADLRARLMAEAAEVMTPGSVLVLRARRPGHRERRLVAAASAVVLLGGSAGMAAASQDALPGDALYPVKRGIERAEAGLSMSSAGKGRDLLQQANGRLDEVAGLLADDSIASAPRVPVALEDFTAQAEQGAALLMDSFEETRDPAAVLSIREFAAEGITALQDLARTAPPEAQEELTAAALSLQEIDVRASGLCSTCAGDLPVLEVPGVLLVASEAGRALTAADPAELDNSHPFLVPKGLVRQGKKAGGAVPRSDVAGGVTGSGSATAPDAATGPAAPGGADVSEPEPKKLEETAQDLGDAVGGAVGGTVNGPASGPGGGTVDDTVGQITDGLSGVVETLLPDPQPGTLLP